LQIIHVTAAYSNAVLVAILPHVNDFTKKIDLPISLPITVNQVEHFNPSRIQGSIGGGLWLTNGVEFVFDNGYVCNFKFLTNNPWLSDDPAKDWPHYLGKESMTTNDAIDYARSTLVKLGYNPTELHADIPPISVEGPYDLREGRFPYCQIKWLKEAQTEGDTNGSAMVQFQFNMVDKTLLGMTVISRKLWQPSPKIDVVPETEHDYQRRVPAKMFINTNAPKVLNLQPPQ